MTEFDKNHYRTPVSILDRVQNAIGSFTHDATASSPEVSVAPFSTDNLLGTLDGGSKGMWRSAEGTCYHQLRSSHIVWMNPPYGRGLTAPLVQRITKEAMEIGCKLVLLLPARCDTKLWQDVIWPNYAVLFLYNRLVFRLPSGEPAANGADFPCCLCTLNADREELIRLVHTIPGRLILPASQVMKGNEDV